MDPLCRLGRVLQIFEAVVRYLPKFLLAPLRLLVLLLLSSTFISLGSSSGKLPVSSGSFFCSFKMVVSFLYVVAFIEILVDCKWLPLDEVSLFNLESIFLCFCSYFTLISVLLSWLMFRMYWVPDLIPFFVFIKLSTFGEPTIELIFEY